MRCYFAFTVHVFLLAISWPVGGADGLEEDVLAFVPVPTPPPVNNTCQEDYSPCSCHHLEFMEYVEVVCDGVPLPSVRSVLNSTTSDITMLRLTLPTENSTVPEDMYGGKRVLYTVLTCSTSLLPLEIHAEAFRSTRDYTRALEIKGCDLGNLDYGFLVDFTVLRSFKLDSSFNMSSFQTLPNVLPSLSDLSIANSPDMEDFTDLLDQPFLTNLTSLEIHNCSNFTSFNGLPSLPGLRSLIITKCPQFKEWSVFNVQLTKLNGISLSGSRLGDQAVDEMLNALVSSPVAETLTYLNLRDNLMTRIPPQIVHLNKLKDLNLAYNKIALLGNGSALNFTSIKVATLYLFGNELLSVDPEAFEGDLGGTRIDLQNNNLTRFESSVFEPLLEKMEKAVTEAVFGRIMLYQNPIECDCHISWLIRDRPSLLDHISLAYCSNGTSFHRLDPNGFSNCNEAPQTTTEELPVTQPPDRLEIPRSCPSRSYSVLRTFTILPFILSLCLLYDIMS